MLEFEKHVPITPSQEVQKEQTDDPGDEYEPAVHGEQEEAPGAEKDPIIPRS